MLAKKAVVMVTRSLCGRAAENQQRDPLQPSSTARIISARR
jgi:hypothetical protein